MHPKRSCSGARIRDVTDDQYGSDIPATAPRRRIPVYVSIPVVLAFGLIGYGLSLALPLHRAPAPAAATTKPAAAKGAEAAPARGDASSASAAASTAVRAATAAEKTVTSPPAAKPTTPFAPPARLGRIDPPAAAQSGTQSPAPATAVETGSVEHAPQRATSPAGDKTAARPSEAPEAARAPDPPSSVADPQPGAKRAEGAPRKRVRRVYRPRPQPKQAKGPFETLFPALAK